MENKAVIFDENAVSRAITRISFEILEKNKGADNVCVIGILTRGRDLATRIAAKMSSVENMPVPTGYIDITPYRDDIVHEASYVEKSNIPFDISGKKVVLVDDVLYTGRSIRAAIDCLMSRGRPKKIELAVLIDRGHRELPIRPDYIGKNVPTSKGETVKVNVKEVDGNDFVAIMGKDNK